MINAIISQLIDTTPEAMDALLAVEQLNHVWQKCTSDKWQMYARLRWGDLPPVRDFKHFCLKRQYINDKVDKRKAPKPHWCEGLYLCVEVIVGHGSRARVFKRTLALEEAIHLRDHTWAAGEDLSSAEDGQRFVGVGWRLPELEKFDGDVAIQTLLREGDVRFGACYLWRESDERMCVLAHDQVQTSKVNAKYQRKDLNPYVGCGPYPKEIAGSESIAPKEADDEDDARPGMLSYDLHHALYYNALFLKGIRSWRLETGSGEYSTPASLRSRLTICYGFPHDWDRDEVEGMYFPEMIQMDETMLKLEFSLLAMTGDGEDEPLEAVFQGRAWGEYVVAGEDPEEMTRVLNVLEWL